MNLSQCFRGERRPLWPLVTAYIDLYIHEQLRATNRRPQDRRETTETINRQPPVTLPGITPPVTITGTGLGADFFTKRLQSQWRCAIVFILPYISTVDRGPFHGRHGTTPFSECPARAQLAVGRCLSVSELA